MSHRIAAFLRLDGWYSDLVSMQLERHEQFAFVGLIRLMVRIDGDFSPAEVGAMQTLAKRFGSGVFWALMAESQETLVSDEEVLAVAGDVIRPEVQRWMYQALLELAAVDGIHPNESRLLDWLIEKWQLCA